MEDLYFFDPTHLYKAFMSSDIAANIWPSTTIFRRSCIILVAGHPRPEQPQATLHITLIAVRSSHVANLRDFLPADLNPKMHFLELIIAIEHVSFVSESHIRSGPIHVELDYASGEKKDKLQDYGQVKIPKAGERFVRRIVDSLESMQFTPLCHTDPMTACKITEQR
jgi:hypothetical protein